MQILTAFLGLLTLSEASTCYTYTGKQLPTWEDISRGKKFQSVATNLHSDSIWAVLDRQHSSRVGYLIGKYNSGAW